MGTLRRPTLPISEWRIATHLDATKSVQHQVGTPAYKCTCQWCENWRAVFSDVIPLELSTQLLRIGIKPDLPTDLYAYEQSPGFVSCRITYHVVGKLLSGPDVWLNGSKNPDRVLNYHQMCPQPNFVLLAIYPHRQGHCPGPALEDEAAGELLQVDLRIRLPFKQ